MRSLPSSALERAVFRQCLGRTSKWATWFGLKRGIRFSELSNKGEKVMPLLVFAGALIASATFTRWVRDFSFARGWAAPPSSDRHIHTRPIPRLGGVAIFLTLWCMVLAAHWVPGHFGTREFPLPPFALKILGPASIIFLLGLIDDFFGVNAYVKFAVQAGAAALLYWNGFGISHLSFLAGHPHLGWLAGLPPAILWVLWINNAFNLIDCLDGLAAGPAPFYSQG